MLHTKLHPILLALLSGALLFLSFPYTGSLYLLSFIAFVPLLLAEDALFEQKKKSFHVFLTGYVCFFLYNLGATWWIAYADFYGAVMAILANALLMALVFLFFHWVKKYVGYRQGYLALIFFWISFEYTHYHWELSWPWLNLGNIFASEPILIQWYEFTGVLGGTLWILMLNILLFKLYKDRFIYKQTIKEQPLYLGVFMLAFALPISISIAQYYSYEEEKKPLDVVVTQPNINPYTEKFGDYSLSLQTQLDRFLTVADSLVTPKTQFVLAPETAIPIETAEEHFEQTSIYTYLDEHISRWKNAVLYVGASTTLFYPQKHSRASKSVPEGGFYESYNSSLLIGKGVPTHFIHKSKLVLGVEIIPFSSIFPFLESWALQMGGASGSLGIADKPEVLSYQKTRFAPLVCYESIYGAYVAHFTAIGAQVLFIITNDGWWDDTPGYKQHFAFARLRAIETRRSVARSANTGISGFINQRGDVMKASKWDEQTALSATINKNDKTTFYAKFGDWIGYSSELPAIFLLLLSLLNAYRHKRLNRK